MDKLFSEWLQEQLDKNNLSRAEFSRRAGISRQAVTNYLNGARQKPDYEIATAISRALKLPLETVFEAAGILKPTYSKDDEKDPTFLEWVKLYLDADENQREVMLENARFFASRGAVNKRTSEK